MGNFLPNGIRFLTRNSVFCAAVFLSIISVEATPVLANPAGGTVSAGSATISSSGNILDVTQTTTKAVIDWRSFDIAPGETTKFIQPSSSAMTLNRINSATPSQIFGHLTANGNIVIVNPSGVVFGAGSQVDVNGLLATTAGISNQAFMADGPMSFNQPGNPAASIVNDGNITAANAGLIGLVAPNVINNGVITAKLGTVQLASADSLTMDFYGDGLLSFGVSPAVQKQLVANSGLISAAGGKIALTAAAGNSIVNSLITVSGELSAPAVAETPGDIYIYAEGSNAVKGNVAANKGQKSGSSTVLVDGYLDASGYGTGQTGGTISLLGDNIGIMSGALLDASGDAGGGTIKIGGDFHGAGTTPTALTTYVDPNASIFANAITTGNGGNVAVWSDGITDFAGTILAKGGTQSGDGGNIETSGEKILHFENGAVVDTSAPNGATGMLLLDPANITIMAGTGDGAADGNTTFKGNATVGTIIGADSLATVYQSELQGIAATTNISLAATSGITINNLGGTLNLAQTAGHSVTFSAGTGGFTMSGSDTIATAGGALNITTTGGTSTIGNLSTGAGLVTLNVGGTTTVSGVINNTGGLTIGGAGTLYLTGNNTYSGTTTLSAGMLEIGNTNALGTSTLSLNGGSLEGDGTAYTLSNAVTITASSTIAGSSALTCSGAVTESASVTLTDNNSALTKFGGAGNTFSLGATTMTAAGSGTLEIDDVISGATGGITENGTGTLYLTGNNTYASTSGTTNVRAGTLQIGNTNALGGSDLLLNGGSIQGDGTAYTLANTVGLSVSSTINGSSALTFGTVVNSGSLTLTISNTALTKFGAVLLSNNATSQSTA